MPLPLPLGTVGIDDQKLALSPTRYKSRASTMNSNNRTKKAGKTNRKTQQMQQQMLMSNLQQQLQLLQVENRVLKDSTSTAGRGVAGPTGPLEMMLGSLRKKYEDMETEKNARLEALEEDNDRLITANRRLTKDLNRATQEHRQTKEELAKLERQFRKELEAIMAGKLAVEHTTAKLAREMEALEEAKNKYELRVTAEQAKASAEQGRLTSQLATATRELVRVKTLLQQARETSDATTARVIELKEERDGATKDLRTAIETLSAEKATFRRENRKMALELEETNAIVEKQKKTIKSLLAANDELEQRVDDAKQNIEEWKARWKANLDRGEVWSQRIAEQERVLNERQTLLDTSSQQVLQLQRDLDTTSQALAGTRADLSQLQTELQETKAGNSRCEHHCNELKQQLVAAQARLAYLEHNQARREGAVAELQQKLAESDQLVGTLQATKETLERRMRVSKQLQDLDLGKLSSILHEHSQAAATLQRAVGVLSTEGMKAHGIVPQSPTQLRPVEEPAMPTAPMASTSRSTARTARSSRRVRGSASSIRTSAASIRGSAASIRDTADTEQRRRWLPDSADNTKEDQESDSSFSQSEKSFKISSLHHMTAPPATAKEQAQKRVENWNRAAATNDAASEESSEEESMGTERSFEISDNPLPHSVSGGSAFEI